MKPSVDDILIFTKTIAKTINSLLFPGESVPGQPLIPLFIQLKSKIAVSLKFCAPRSEKNEALSSWTSNYNTHRILPVYACVGQYWKTSKKCINLSFPVFIDTSILKHNWAGILKIAAHRRTNWCLLNHYIICIKRSNHTYETFKPYVSNLQTIRMKLPNHTYEPAES